MSSAVSNGRVVHLFTKYDQQAASTRVRFTHLIPALAARGWTVRHYPLLPDAVLANLYASGRHDYGLIASSYGRFLGQRLAAPRADIHWVEKELLAGLPDLAERVVMPGLDRTVVDYDDAVYLDFRDTGLGPFGRAAKFRRYARRAAHITVGSEALREQFVAWGAKHVTKIPSTVPVAKYPRHTHRDGAPITIGWIGTPRTAHFLEPVREVLRDLARTRPIRFRVVGARWECPGVDVVHLPWSEATEAELVAGFDIGIMPLTDGPWERAKCGYKLIQYMAAGVVPVGSRVGENPMVIQDAENGFLASSPAEWREKLDRLCTDASLRTRIGEAAHAKAAATYDIAHAAAAVDAVFRQVAKPPSS